MIHHPYIVVAKARGLIVAVSLHFTKKWADRSAAEFLASCKQSSNVTAEVFSLPQLIAAFTKQETAREVAEVDELERMANL